MKSSRVNKLMNELQMLNPNAKVYYSFEKPEESLELFSVEELKQEIKRRELLALAVSLSMQLKSINASFDEFSEVFKAYWAIE